MDIWLVGGGMGSLLTSKSGDVAQTLSPAMLAMQAFWTWPVPTRLGDGLVIRTQNPRLQL